MSELISGIVPEKIPGEVLKTAREDGRGRFLVARQIEVVKDPQGIMTAIQLTLANNVKVEMSRSQILSLHKFHKIQEIRNGEGVPLFFLEQLREQPKVDLQAQKADKVAQQSLPVPPKPVETSSTFMSHVVAVTMYPAASLAVAKIATLAQKVLGSFQVLSIFSALVESYHFVRALGRVGSASGAMAKAKEGVWAFFKATQAFYSSVLFVNFLSVMGKVAKEALKWTPFALLGCAALAAGYGVYNTYKMWSLKKGLQEAGPAFRALEYVKKHQEEFASRFSIQKEWKFQEKMNALLALSAEERLNAVGKADELVAALKTHVKSQLSMEIVSTVWKVVTVAVAAIVTIALATNPIGWAIVAACAVIGLAIWVYREIKNAYAEPFSQISPISVPLLQETPPARAKPLSLPLYVEGRITSFDDFFIGIKKRKPFMPGLAAESPI